MPDCTVSDCNFSMSEKCTYQSFYLPKDEKLKYKWLHNMNRPNLMEISNNPKVSILGVAALWVNCMAFPANQG